MKQHLAELVDVILRQIDNQAGSPPSERGMRTWLVRQGYNKRDIDAAIALVLSRLSVAPAVSERTPGAVRHLSHYEFCKLCPEARDALARLELYDLIDPYERELLLERLGQYEGEVTLDDLDYLLSWVMCTTRDVESQQTVYNVFEGRRDALH
jgi:uncharacterized protein Smg (DUF494 family)